MALRNIGEVSFPARALRLARYPTRVSPQQVLADMPNAVAVMAGPMYARTASRSCGGGVKPCTRWLDSARGVDLVGPIADAGITISVVEGEATARPKNAVEPGAEVAIQLYPTIAWNGAARGTNTGESSVAGLGLKRDGSLVYLVASGGSPLALGAELVARGAVAAGYCDAGSSAALYVRDEGYRGAHARDPKLPGWLVVEKLEGIWVPPWLKRAGVACGAAVAGYAFARIVFG